LRSPTRDPHAALTVVCDGAAQWLRLRNRKSTSVPVLDAPATLTLTKKLLDVGVVILDPGISAVETRSRCIPRSAKPSHVYSDRARRGADRAGWLGRGQGSSG
jgi:hypothetical protein